MKYALLFVGLLCSNVGLFAQKCNLKKGAWIGELQITPSEILPFNIDIQKEGKQITFNIINAEEVISLKNGGCINDSFHVQFPSFNSELVFLIENKKRIKGYWRNKDKKNYTIPFSAHYGKKEPRFVEIPNDVVTDYSGKWEAAFEPGTTDEYPALGIFNQEGKNLTGTFLTETGDYRYLQGNAYGSNLRLSCFDGSHAFLFTASITTANTIEGKFYSGKHWESNWTATRNENFELPSPDSLTYVTTGSTPFTFTLKDLNGAEYVYPNDATTGKVTIIQIMGTWCPNCMDETRYYKELYDKYHDKGLEIISIGYEIGETHEDFAKRIKLLQERMNLDFTFLVGGKASKNLASDQFAMLNEIISFPTSIFIDRDGNVVRVHTGFNGPGTGTYYTEYVNKTTALIESLLGI